MHIGVGKSTLEILPWDTNMVYVAVGFPMGTVPAVLNLGGGLHPLGAFEFHLLPYCA